MYYLVILSRFDVIVLYRTIIPIVATHIRLLFFKGMVRVSCLYRYSN